MKVISSVGQLRKSLRPSLLAIGVFDGVHLGHRYLIEKMVTDAKIAKARAVVITFYPHPVHVIHPHVFLSYLVSLKHRLKLIADLGVDICIVIKFTKRFSRLSPEYFLKHYIFNRLNPVAIFVGHDFHFGKNRKGNINILQEMGHRHHCQIYDLAAVKKHDHKISSTHIRKLISDGHLKKAQVLLGREISVFGKVIKGDRRGKTLGFPTANIHLDNHQALPRGVYFAKVILKKKIFYAMANIGYRPSFSKSQKTHVEAHIFNFQRNIYGQDIELVLLKKLRAERTFSSAQELIAQLKKDKQKSLSILTHFSFYR